LKRCRNKIKNEKDGNATDRPNQDSKRHGSNFLLISIGRYKREHNVSDFIAPNDVILNILNTARLKSPVIPSITTGIKIQFQINYFDTTLFISSESRDWPLDVAAFYGSAW